MLPVILWSPIETFAGIISNDCPKCQMNGMKSTLVHIGWTNGKSADHKPRLLHCVQSNVILVSRVYSCSSHHTVYGHHPSIIERFKHAKLISMVPFHLWHITGFTSLLIEEIDHMIHTGMSLNEVERCLSQKRIRLFYTIKTQYMEMNRHNPKVQFPDVDDESMHYWQQSPTRHTIEALFLRRFWETEKVYHFCMSELSISSSQPWLSCDHTFKSVANIGIVRENDGRWITQYSGLFCVLNSEGNILTWKLAKSLTFDEIKECMEHLQLRLQRNGKTLETFYVDNCCSWRKKLVGVFGPQLKVYLDIFHAVQRVAKKIPKRHPYRFQCMESLKLVFREKCDHGTTRTKPTPAPSVLHQNLVKFQQQWENISYDGRKILPPAAVKEIKSLLVHVDKGCLSFILPGHGTNRNERLHRDLNTHMTSSRYGVELAFALITLTFYLHNEANKAKREKKSPKPIMAYKLHEGDQGSERFGLFSDCLSTSQKDTQNNKSLSKVHMEQLEYNFVRADLEFLSIVCSHDEDQESEGEGYVTYDMTNEEAMQVLEQAVSAFYVSKTIKQYSTTANFESRDIFFSSFLALVEGFHHLPGSGQLDHVLQSWNFKKIPVPPDGDCLFTSISLSLINLAQQGDSMVKEHLLSLGIKHTDLQNVTSIQILLRQKMVQEWEENSFYQGFLMDDITSIAPIYLQSGTFSGEIGDLMVLTLANVLQMPITIFTSIENLPILCVMPTTSITITTPIFLTYVQDGPGHYDYAIPVEMELEKNCSALSKKCTCGRKPNFSGEACSGLKCPCVRSKVKCSSLCVCKACTNKYGQRPPPSKTRNRMQYENQKIALSGRPGRNSWKILTSVLRLDH